MKHASTIVGLLAGALIGGYLLLFALENAHPVTIDLVVARFEVAIYAVAAVAFLAGFAVASLVFGASWLRSRAERRRLKQHAATLEEEVQRLRNAPLEDLAAAEEG